MSVLERHYACGRLKLRIIAAMARLIRVSVELSLEIEGKASFRLSVALATVVSEVEGSKEHVERFPNKVLGHFERDLGVL
jgi:hypothetical protein